MGDSKSGSEQKSGDWTEARVPDLTGRHVLVTGANSGIGFEAARVLASRGARVVLACRDARKAADASTRISLAYPSSRLEALALDLADLSSVRKAAASYARDHDRLDLLINNAGVMAIPYRKTDDGFEMQFGTNHLGHFALTGHLLDRLLGTPRSRVVTVSSNAHNIGWMRFEDLQGERRYRRWLAYGQSKLANLLFTYELQRRLSSSGADTIAVAAHPGGSATNLAFVGPEMDGSRVLKAMAQVFSSVFAQSATMGALPTLYGATEPTVTGGDYIGPGGFMEQRGYPVKVSSNKRSHDLEAAARLWAVSVELTGVGYDALAGSRAARAVPADG